MSHQPNTTVANVTARPKPRKRLFRRLILGFAVAIGAVPVVWYVMQHFGPRAPGVGEDPNARRDREHSALNPNAATHYALARERLSEPPHSDWRSEAGRSNLPLDGELTAWVDKNVECIEAIHAAIAIENCYFIRKMAGSIDDREAEETSAITKFLSLRARLAAQRRDLATFADSLLAIERVARHFYAQPGGMISYMRGTGTLSIAADFALVPFTWPAVRADALRAYADQIQSIFVEPDLSQVVWDQERDDAVWMAESQMPTRGWSFVPAERVFGEIDRGLTPVRAFTALPLEAQFARDCSPRMELDLPETIFLRQVWNVPAMVAGMTTPATRRFFQLRIRLIATQRGTRSALAVLKYRQVHGDYPETVAQTISPEPLEPFTNRPFIYRRTADGFTLYAAGWDCDDDGGEHNGRFGELSDREVAGGRISPDGDFVCWPIPVPPDAARVDAAEWRARQAREAAEEAAEDARLRAEQTEIDARNAGKSGVPK